MASRPIDRGVWAGRTLSLEKAKLADAVARHVQKTMRRAERVFTRQISERWLGETSAATFRRPVSEVLGSRRILRLASFAVFGIDVKITPQREVKIIEINGMRSGMRGFKESGTAFRAKNPPLAAPELPLILDYANVITHGQVSAKHGLDNPFDQNVVRHLVRLAGPALPYIGYQLRRRVGFAGGRFPGLHLFQRFNPRGFHPSWGSLLNPLIDALAKIEKTVQDKLALDRCFDDARTLKTTTYPFTKDGRADFLASECPDMVVLKPRRGNQGTGVEVFPVAELANAKRRHSPNWVLEKFVPSKPHKLKANGTLHDGCMRYVVVVEEEKTGELRFRHFGGYWRLAPEPLTAGVSLDALRANLCQGAIPVPAGRRDLQRVRAALEEYLPAVYRTMRGL